MNFANDTTTLIIIIPFNHRQLPKAGNLNKKFPVGRFWRFQVNFKTRSDQTFNLLLLIEVVADPTVEVFASRDVDSFLLPRCEKICMRYTIQYNTCKYKIHKTLISQCSSQGKSRSWPVARGFREAGGESGRFPNPLSWQSGNLTSGKLKHQQQ